MINRKTVDSYAIFWVLGIAFLWWPFVLFRTVRDRRTATRRPIALGITTACLAASLLLAALFNAPLSRVVGAFANLTVWIILWRTVAREPDRAEANAIVRGILDLAVLQGILVVAAHAAYPRLEGARLPLARFLPSSLASDANISAFSTVRLAVPDYFGHVVIRTSGIFGNPTWAGAFAAVAVLFLLFAPDALSPWMARPLVRSGLVVLMAVTLYNSYARVDDLALIVAVVTVVALRLKVFVHPGLWMASVCVAVAATVAALPLLPLRAWFDQINKSRQGSLVARVDIYGPTLQAISRAPTPLLGSGIKQRVVGLVASLGTHSTYVGLAYRGGILAAVGFVVFLVALGYCSFDKNAALAFGLVCFLLLFCVTDDIDSGHLLPLVVIVAYGLLSTSPEKGKADPPEGQPDGLQPTMRE